MLTSIQICHLRPLLHINWKARVPDVEILKQANMDCAEIIITASQLRWAGYVRRMPDTRLPKLVLYGELGQDNCTVGGQTTLQGYPQARHKEMLLGPE